MLTQSVFLLSLISTGLMAMNSLTPVEQNELDARIRAFYQKATPEQMNQKIPKFSITKNNFVSPNQDLKSDKKSDNPLINLAGKKAEEKFQKEYCEKFLKKNFPSLDCEGLLDASIQPNDRVEDLTETWVDNVTHDLDQIPTTGKAAVTPWSDDYWRTRWGLTSYRYSEGQEFPTYKEAVAAYSQPLSWTRLIQLSTSEIVRNVLAWSPSEKYDLAVGDEGFTLTNEQKNEGQSNLGPDGNVEEWMGLCHGWAAVANVVSRPLKPVSLTGTNGVQVQFYPNDIKALLTLGWSNGDFKTNFIGGRCNAKKPQIYPNGRLKQQECFDNNPATFHLVLGNMLGNGKVPFAYDKTFDYEVWNQPVTSYEITYFNPLQPAKRSKKWKEVAVDYDDAFKAKDRFQNPNTRGENGRDANVRKIVGVIATVIYVSEYSPIHSPNPQNDELVRESYTYDLELSEENGKLIPTGGEWHSNLHPDFLWAAQKGSFASSKSDKIELDYDGKSEPSDLVTKTARKASNEANPLCQVIKVLVKESSGMDYPCPTDRN